MYDQNLSQLKDTVKKVMWADFPTHFYRNPMACYTFYEDFTNFNGTIVNGAPPVIPGWTTAEVGAVGNIIQHDWPGGVCLLDSEGAAQHNGVQMQKDGAGFMPAAGKDIWFEAAFYMDSDVTNSQIFLGLAEADATFMPSGVLSNATDYIGFCIAVGGADALTFVSNNATANVAVACATLADTTWYRVAFWIDGITEAHQYIGTESGAGNIQITDDAELAATIVTANIPITPSVLLPTFVCQADGAVDPIMFLEYCRITQLR